MSLPSCRSTSAAWLHHGRSLINWPLTWDCRKTPQVLTLGSMALCYSEEWADTLLFHHARKLKMGDICHLRRGVLVDHSPSLQAEIRRREGQSGGRPHPGQRLLWEIPGMTLETFLTFRFIFQCLNRKTLRLNYLNLPLYSISLTLVGTWWWMPPSCRHSGTWILFALGVSWLRVRNLQVLISTIVCVFCIYPRNDALRTPFHPC